MEILQYLNYLPLNGEVVFLAVSTLLTGGIIYFWMRFYHEPPHPFHALLVGFIANFQNFVIPFLVLYLPIPYVFQVAPILFWILIIRIFYLDIGWKHVIAISLLSYGTFALLEISGVIGIIYSML